jgi:predicted amidophosphoribosyltransferase
VLLDDIVTTGATLCACRATLVDVGITADTAVALCDATSGRDDHEHPAAS